MFSWSNAALIVKTELKDQPIGIEIREVRDGRKTILTQYTEQSRER